MLKLRRAREEDLQQIEEVLYSCFHHLAMSFNDTMCDDHLLEPGYALNDTFVATKSGRVVAHVGVYAANMWLAGMLVPCGLVGGVATHPDYRGLGIAHKLLQYALQQSSASGLIISVLRATINRFYRKIGYVECAIEDHVYRVLVNHNETHRTTLLEPSIARQADVPDLMRIHDSYFQRRPGVISRTPLFWTRRVSGVPRRWITCRPMFYLFKLGHSSLGYAALASKQGYVQVCELAAYAEAKYVLDDILSAMVDWIIAYCRQVSANVVDFRLPEDDRVLAALKNYCPTEIRTDTGFMIKVINEDEFLSQVMSAEYFMERLNESALPVHADTQLSECDNIRLVLQEEKEIGLSNSLLSALMFNGDSAAKIGFTAMPQGSEIAFPRTTPFHPLLDRY